MRFHEADCGGAAGGRPHADARAGGGVADGTEIFFVLSGRVKSCTAQAQVPTGSRRFCCSGGSVPGGALRSQGRATGQARCGRAPGGTSSGEPPRQRTGCHLRLDCRSRESDLAGMRDCHRCPDSGVKPPHSKAVRTKTSRLPSGSAQGSQGYQSAHCIIRSLTIGWTCRKATRLLPGISPSSSSRKPLLGCIISMGFRCP